MAGSVEGDQVNPRTAQYFARSAVGLSPAKKESPRSGWRRAVARLPHYGELA